ncbi:MAG: protein kinase [Deltaproteobacteria bacterium]|nr:protein kinase [Deltaproteobacteria bacterium]
MFGAYVVGELLGAGGMATVHRAEDRARRRVVALKRLLPSLSEDPEIVRSFVGEARLAMELHHPNIAETYDAGIIDGTHYIAMELVSGPTLAQIVRQIAAARVGAIPMGIVLAMIAQVCDGLDHAHNLTDASGAPLGLVHRDVSPVNLIVSNKGIVKLIDFGIVKVRNSDVHTAAGTIKGKFAYLAPETMGGGPIDHRADLFGLGVIAHELLAGRRLFHAGTDLATIHNITELPIQPPSRWSPEVTRDIDDIVLTALQRDPAARWQSGRAMRAAIANAMDHLKLTTGPAEVLAWVEWAFTQLPRREVTGLVDALAMLEEGTTGVRELTDSQRAELSEIGGDLTPTPKAGRSMPLAAPPDSGPAKLLADSVVGGAAKRDPKMIKTLPLGATIIPPRPTATVAAQEPVAPTQKSLPPAVTEPAPEPRLPPARSEGYSWFMWVLVIVVMAGAGAAFAYFQL